MSKGRFVEFWWGFDYGRNRSRPGKKSRLSELQTDQVKRVQMPADARLQQRLAVYDEVFLTLLVISFCLDGI